MIPRAFINEVISKTEIVELIREFMLLEEHKGSFEGICPFYRSSRFRVSQAKRIFKCFSCGKGGDAARFVMLVQRKDFVETVGFLAVRLGLEVPGEGL